VAAIAFFVAGTTFLLVVTDTYTTVVGIESGCTHEINPAKRNYTTDDFIFYGYRNAFILSFLVALLTGAALGKRSRTAFIYMLAIILGIMFIEAFIVYHNVQELSTCLKYSG